MPELYTVRYTLKGAGATFHTYLMKNYYSAYLKLALYANTYDDAVLLMYAWPPPPGAVPGSARIVRVQVNPYRGYLGYAKSRGEYSVLKSLKPPIPFPVENVEAA